MKKRFFNGGDTIIPTQKLKRPQDFQRIFSEPNGARASLKKNGEMPFDAFLKRNINKPRVSRTRMTSI